MSGTTAQEPAIRDLIQRYKICWEVWPEWIPTKGHLEKTAFEPALRSASIRKNRRDVRSEMKIIHRNGLGPIDECEERCLQLMQSRLDAFGVYRGRWAPDPDYPSRKYIRRGQWETLLNS